MINSEKTKGDVLKVFTEYYLDGKMNISKHGKEIEFMEDNRILSEEEKETVNNFKELLDEDREAFIRSAYMTGLYIHLEKLQWAIITDKEWKGGKRALAYIKIQNMMNMAYNMIDPNFEYLLEEELAEWTEERRKREEI